MRCGVRGGCDDVRTAGTGELDRELPDPAGGAGDQQPPPEDRAKAVQGPQRRGPGHGELFTAQGFDATTLDDLCAAATEVSKRTFFRYFTSKEEVAMAPTEDLWLTFLDDLNSRRPPGLVLDLLQESLLAALAQMPAEGWAHRVLLSRRLAEQTPSMGAHGLQFCDRTSRAAVRTLHHRFRTGDPGDPRPRLALDMLVAAFHCALESWAAHADEPTRDDLADRTRATLAAIPSSLTLTVADPGRLG